MDFVVRLTESEHLARKFDVIAVAKTRTLQPEEYIYCRRYLIMQLLYQNSQRSGTVTNMTMEEAKVAKQVKSDNEDFLLVVVKNHKTSMMYGSAKVVISEDVQDALQPSET